jgi:hypothetical protein
VAAGDFDCCSSYRAGIPSKAALASLRLVLGHCLGAFGLPSELMVPDLGLMPSAEGLLESDGLHGEGHGHGEEGNCHQYGPQTYAGPSHVCSSTTRLGRDEFSVHPFPVPPSSRARLFASTMIDPYQPAESHVEHDFSVSIP